MLGFKVFFLHFNFSSTRIPYPSPNLHVFHENIQALYKIFFSKDMTIQLQKVRYKYKYVVVFTENALYYLDIFLKFCHHSAENG